MVVIIATISIEMLILSFMEFIKLKTDANIKHTAINIEIELHFRFLMLLVAKFELLLLAGKNYIQILSP